MPVCVCSRAECRARNDLSRTIGIKFHIFGCNMCFDLYQTVTIRATRDPASRLFFGSCARINSPVCTQKCPPKCTELFHLVPAQRFSDECLEMQSVQCSSHMKKQVTRGSFTLVPHVRPTHLALLLVITPRVKASLYLLIKNSPSNG